MKFQFGDVVVDEDARQVRRAGADVHVSPKAFDLLITLIRERPRALSKADLHARIWPQTFVSDTSLAMLVAEVRAALGESARESESVRTVHRHGYAFQAAVRELPTEVRADAHQLASPGTGVTCWLITPAGQVPLSPGDNIVGRDPGSRIWLDAPSVSRRHARISVHGEAVVLEDLGSKNGTRAGSAAVMTPTTLADGDELRFGSVGVTFRMSVASATLTEGGA